MSDWEGSSEVWMEEEEDEEEFVMSPVKATKKKSKKAAEKENAPKRKAAPKKAKAAKAAPKKKKKGGANMARNAVGEEQRVEDVYQKLTQLEHVLLRPDTYIGSTELQKEELWVWNEMLEQMELRKVEYAPGLYKIFDEILVNAADNKQRDPSMKTIKVEIDAENSRFSVYNDGAGIPVVVHEEHDMYVPELVFGHLMAGANFNDAIDKVVGGRNGLGAKLTNIFSRRFKVTCFDGERGKKFEKEWRDNMASSSKSKVTSLKRKTDFVQVEFVPDLERFNLEEVTPDIVALFQKRVYDVAGCNPGLSVYLNGKKLKVSRFSQYIDLYPIPTKSDGTKFKRVIESPHERWEIGVTVSPDGNAQQMSFVNSINTIRGGTHVTWLTKKIADHVRDQINNSKAGKNVAKINSSQVKNYMWIFVRCLIVNPAFDSQTKHTLTTKVSAFGSRPTLDTKFLDKVARCGIKEYVLDWASFKAKKQLKRVGGKKTARITGIEKLDDANNAGTKKAQDCTLILTEGDSAKTLAVSGLSVVGRDNYGVFPLRGKPLNVREAAHTTVMKNKEIKALLKIIGLQPGKKYESTKELRYGRLMIMADQDVDGSHIKGLLINMIHNFWPELLKLGFVVEFITPIIKARKGKETIPFFTLPEYEAWKEDTPQKGWSIKYYKGLGTSDPQEAREYFGDLRTHVVKFKYNAMRDDEAILTAFSKKRADQRKEWIAQSRQTDFLSTASGSVTVKDFVDRELRLFSVEDNKRSIPCIMDGLKPSQRKVLFGCFKRKLTKDVKVAQLSGYVSEHAAYHHGEQSLQGTIVNMAQTFVGANNINLLFPSGQFGSRLMGGKDASAARYIFTRLSDITRAIYHPHDDAVLKYLNDDGIDIEPEWYAPILPMVLVNGSSGIGSGWSSDIPNFNPRDLVDNLRRLLRGQAFQEMTPWYRGFLGSIEKKDWSKKATRNGYSVLGEYEMDESTGTMRITELPVGTWTADYKAKLNKWSHDYSPEEAGKKSKRELKSNAPVGFVEEFKEYHTDTHVDFEVRVLQDKLKEVLAYGVEKTFKLAKSISVNNMVLFNAEGGITRYECVEDIVREFYTVRLDMYRKRKEWLVGKLRAEHDVLDNKVRFIEAVIAEQVVVRNRPKQQLVQELEDFGFTQKEGENNFDYLLGMAIWSLTKERADALREQLAEKKAELDRIIQMTPKQMWLEDLDAFDEAYEKFEEDMGEREAQERKSARMDKKTKSRIPAKKKAPAKKQKKKAAAPAPAPAPPAKKTKKKKQQKQKEEEEAPGTPLSGLDLSIYDYSDDEEDDDLDGLSDIELSDEIIDLPKPKPKAAAAKPKPKAKPKAKRKKQLVLDDEEEEDEEEEEELSLSPIKPRKRTRRAAVSKPIVVVDDDEEFEEAGEEFSDFGSSFSE